MAAELDRGDTAPGGPRPPHARSGSRGRYHNVRGTDLRFPADVETAVYFCCAEALQNVVKHAAAHQAWVTVDAGPAWLCFEVRDDGRGLGSRNGAGSGLQNMADRLAALGGRLDVVSDGVGTRVSGGVPLPRTGDTPERMAGAVR